MHHIIYLSQATVPFDAPQLAHLLAQASAFNATHDITGLLLYGNEQFLQVLEGEEATVQVLYGHIRRDPRHRDVTTYADEDIAARAFADWRMAFQALPPRQVLEFAGYLSPTEVKLAQPHLNETDRQLLQLLRTFVLPARELPRP